MLEFPSPRNNWRLDIVSILAVLGESNVKVNGHLITAQWTCLLPRLMPAPQGLLAEKHMKRMPLEDDVLRCGLYVGELTIKWDDDTLSEEDRRSPAIASRLLSAISIIAMISSMVSLGLLIWAALTSDGVAVLGIIVMSFAAPVLCAGSRYHLRIPARAGGVTPPENVVFRTRDGAFTVVHCNEDIARLLCFSPEAPAYTMDVYTNRLSRDVVGGLMSIVSISLFGNCSWTMQVAYAFLNVSYWVAAILPERHSWRFDTLIITTQERIRKASFTAAFWVAMNRSRTTSWVKASRAIPDTRVWDGWLQEAGRNINESPDAWDSHDAFGRLLRANMEKCMNVVGDDAVHDAMTMSRGPVWNLNNKIDLHTVGIHVGFPAANKVALQSLVTVQSSSTRNALVLQSHISATMDDLGLMENVLKPEVEQFLECRHTGQSVDSNAATKSSLLGNDIAAQGLMTLLSSGGIDHLPFQKLEVKVMDDVSDMRAKQAYESFDAAQTAF
ncbi:hypothetical protein DOTSEDRAFT_79851 [Dothistroma septosporum NZE10]|uniref:Uncharacterized protein n=1 Tax=Dothistroma septosporum (strain NZE10 / CBS 128990) TaxID=675120 RepID=N1PLL4_DOTSN|nr:hypothetical protein DOTSEDRAFT_79851 [Dothistroma septosporum NZE10]